MQQNFLRYKNTWNSNIVSDANLLKKAQKDLAFDESELKIYFSQEKSSSQYNFDYYFNILFEKI
jgi:DNA gyrase/topoisomerase IV subunit B